MAGAPEGIIILDKSLRFIKKEATNESSQNVGITWGFLDSRIVRASATSGCGRWSGRALRSCSCLRLRILQLLSLRVRALWILRAELVLRRRLYRRRAMVPWILWAPRLLWTPGLLRAAWL